MSEMRIDSGWPAAANPARTDLAGHELDDRVVALAEVRRRLAAEFGTASAATRIDSALTQIEAGLRALADVDDADLASLDAVECRQWLERLERSRRMIEAASVRAAGVVDQSNPFRSQGFLSARTVLGHMLQLSGVETHRRLQTARMHTRLDRWAGAAIDGDVGVAQSEAMAKVAANPRIDDAVLQRDAPELLADAQSMSFRDFHTRVRTWEALADPDADHQRNDAVTQARDVQLIPRRDGYGYTLSGLLPELDGAEFAEVFSWFTDAEWQTDWAEARERLGDAATTADLLRTEAQRRADALVKMARAAAANTGVANPRITLNIAVDQATYEAHLHGETRDPIDYRDVVCRTADGRRLHPDDAVNASLIAHVRRVVYDSAGTVIDLGRRSRLFRGAARDAVFLQASGCVWTGCDRPLRWCEADHSLGWKAHGPTVPRNGDPLCRAHQLLKEGGFRVHRDIDGNWHVIDHDGSEVI